MFRRVMGASALVLVAGLAAAGCAPVKTGAAAVVGSNRITIANLDTESSHLSAGAKQYPGVVTLTQQQITDETLSWLIRFQINDRLASQNGLTVSTADVQQALAAILLNAQQNAAQQGLTNVSLEEILVSAGIAPNLQDKVGRWQAVQDAYFKSINGGKMPTSSSPNLSSLENQFALAQCQAAKSLRIKVNPQFGRLDYAHYAVVPGVDSLSRPSGPAVAATQVQAAPSC